MSQENVEVVRSLFSAWNAGEMEAVRGLLDPGIVLRPPEGWPEPGPYVGADATLREWQQIRDAWKADAIETIGGFAHVSDHVVVRMVWRTDGKGPAAQMEATHVATIRNGMIVLYEYFWNHAEALKAVGLEQ